MEEYYKLIRLYIAIAVLLAIAIYTGILWSQNRMQLYMAHIKGVATYDSMHAVQYNFITLLSYKL